ncbi:MAG TPA: hypothetical protein VK652_16465, partial [Steroidobacteraceae bacterium]|nr:hypothetical protein [Steroidobacteraceae bacterium]
KPRNTADAPSRANPSGADGFAFIRRCRLLIGIKPNFVGSASTEGKSGTLAATRNTQTSSHCHRANPYIPDDSTPEFIAGGMAGSAAGTEGDAAVGGGDAIGAGLGLGGLIAAGFGAGIAFFGAAFLGAAFFGAVFLTALFAFALTFFLAFTGRVFLLATLFLAERFAELRLAFAIGRFDLRFFDLLFFAMIILLLKHRSNSL